MNWFAQVRHVIAKNVRRARVYLALYVVAVAVTTAFVIGPTVPSFAMLDWSTLLLLGVGLLLLAALVQSDSPSRVESFWKSLPLDPGAVVAAKLLMTALVLVLPAIGGFVALRAVGSPTGLAVRSIGQATLGLALCTLAVLITAALTRDLRSLLLACVATPIAWIVLALAFMWATGVDLHLQRLPPGLPLPIAIAAGLGALFMLAYLYRRWNIRWVAWSIAIFLASAAMVSPFLDSAHPALGAPPAPPVDLTLERDTAGAPMGGGLALEVNVTGAPADVKVGLFIDSIAVRPRHAAHGRAFRRRFEVTIQQPQLAGARRPYATRFRPPQIYAYTNRQRDEPMVPPSDVGGVDVFGHVMMSRLVSVATLPMRVGASVAGAGGRAQMLRVQTGGDSVTLALRLLTMRSGPDLAFVDVAGNYSAMVLDLINDARHEALSVPQAGMSGSDVSLVMPGAWGRTYDITFRTSVEGGNALPVDSLPPLAWYRGAHVQLSQLVRLETQPVHLVYTSPN